MCIRDRLKILSLQSTSDQTDYLYNANIAANVASAVTPEQGGMWVYPYEDEDVYKRQRHYTVFRQNPQYVKKFK